LKRTVAGDAGGILVISPEQVASIGALDTFNRYQWAIECRQRRRVVKFLPVVAN